MLDEQPVELACLSLQLIIVPNLYAVIWQCASCGRRRSHTATVAHFHHGWSLEFAAFYQFMSSASASCWRKISSISPSAFIQ